jgi:hypothetical protein
MNAFADLKTRNEQYRYLSDVVKKSGPFSAAKVYRFLKSLNSALNRLPSEMRLRVGPKSLVIDRRERLRINPRRLYPQSSGACWWLAETSDLEPAALCTRQLACLAYWMLTGSQPFLAKSLLPFEKRQTKLLGFTTTAVANQVQLAIQSPASLTTREFIRGLGHSLLQVGGYQVSRIERFTGNKFHFHCISGESDDYTILKHEERASGLEAQRNIGRFYLNAKLAMQVPAGLTPRVYEVAADGAVHYCVQQPLKGRYLSDLVQADGPLSPAAALGMMAQIAERLSALHQEGLLLRNIHPGNLFLCDGGEVLFTWLGDCRINDLAIDLVEPQHAVGNRLFSAPEVMLDASSAEVSSDLFSLAAVLYYLLFGASPFAAIPKDLLYRHKKQREPWRGHLLETRFNQQIQGLFDRVLCRRSERVIRDAGHFATVCRKLQRRVAGPEQD